VRSAGYSLIYLGFGYGLVCAVGLVRGALAPARSGPPIPAASIGLALAALGSVAVLGSLWLDWITGVGRQSRVPVTLSGWTGLDALSLGAIVLVAGAIVGAGARRPTDLGAMVGGGACLVALVVGNGLVQATAPGGSRVAVGFVVGGTAATVVFGGALLAARRGSERHARS